MRAATKSQQLIFMDTHIVGGREREREGESEGEREGGNSFRLSTRFWCSLNCAGEIIRIISKGNSPGATVIAPVKTISKKNVYVIQ